MKLSVATNFDNHFVDQATRYPVGDFYGKLPEDVVGGGRSSYMIGQISSSKFEKHVAHVRKNNFGFNYLLNASCLNNLETSREGQNKIRKLLKWMSDIGVTATTISNPLLLRIIKDSYPKLKVRISVYACVDHAQKAIYWEKNGADIICLDSLTVNRDLDALKSIRSASKIDLELLANGNCLQSCSLCHTHMNLLAHSSQKKHSQKGFVIDHCILECSKAKVKNPVNYIRSDWIRPEDISLYEDLGYHNFKIVERNLPTTIMLNRLEAYSTKKYSGNLIDLVQPYGHEKNSESEQHYKKDRLKRLINFIRPFKVNLKQMKKVEELTKIKGMLTPLKGKQPVYIDNQKLDGFLQNVWSKKCRYRDCEKCQYCHMIAKQVVTVDNTYQDECLSLHKTIEDSLVSGTMWK
jgi:collagenase-like PrtC family protease